MCIDFALHVVSMVLSPGNKSYDICINLIEFGLLIVEMQTVGLPRTLQPHLHHLLQSTTEHNSPLIMTTIDLLSYETLIDTFYFLSTADLGSVSRVSQRWHEICEPVLYREPHLSDRRHNPTAIELFLRTVLAPGGERLVSHVRVLDLQW